MPTHKLEITINYTDDGNQVINYQDKDLASSGSDIAVSESFTDATDALLAFVLDISQVKTIAMWSVGGDMTVKTNSSTVPDDTISLSDGVPKYWSSSITNLINFLTADVTALYITNTGTATLKIHVLYDPTV